MKDFLVTAKETIIVEYTYQALNADEARLLHENGEYASLEAFIDKVDSEIISIEEDK